jgi:hypothetical protein
MILTLTTHCNYAESHVTFVVSLSVITVGDVMLIVVVLNTSMVSVVMVNVIMLNVVMPSDVEISWNVFAIFFYPTCSSGGGWTVVK